MKVLFVAPTAPPYSGLEGVSQFFLESSLRNKFKIIHIRSSLNISNRMRGKLHLGNLWRFVLLCIRVIFSEIKNKPRLLYTILSENTTGFLRSYLVVLIGRAVKNKIVLHLHGSNFGNFYKHSHPMLKSHIRRLLRNTDMVLVLSERLKGQFEGICSPGKIRVVYNGIPAARLSMSQDEFEKHPRDEDRIKILFIGLLSKAKGFGDLLKAIPLVLERHPGAQFLFAGEQIGVERNIFYDARGEKIAFEDTNRILCQIHERHRSAIRLLGVVDEKEKERLFSSANIFVLPSYSEGFPLSILEAMSFGLPIVATPVGALPEVLEDGVHCIFTPIGDFRELAERIIYLLDNPEARLEMGRRNYHYVRSNFDIERSAEAMASAFQEAISN